MYQVPHLGVQWWGKQACWTLPSWNLVQESERQNEYPGGDCNWRVQLLKKGQQLYFSSWMFPCRNAWWGAAGWLSQLSVQFLILAQVIISQFVWSSPALGSPPTTQSLLGISSPSLCPPPAVLSLKIYLFIDTWMSRQLGAVVGFISILRCSWSDYQREEPLGGWLSGP